MKQRTREQGNSLFVQLEACDASPTTHNSHQSEISEPRKHLTLLPSWLLLFHRYTFSALTYHLERVLVEIVRGPLRHSQRLSPVPERLNRSRAFVLCIYTVRSRVEASSVQDQLCSERNLDDNKRTQNERFPLDRLSR